jgi:hypothetical protein
MNGFEQPLQWDTFAALCFAATPWHLVPQYSVPRCVEGNHSPQMRQQWEARILL